jgi:protein-tyrosine-phosphatase
MKRLHWSFEDPALVVGSREERDSAFREIRDQIRERIGTELGNSINYAPDTESQGF